ncbi:hypothetical protein GGI21_004004 [Coemansia aciculifera]|nr:hypothetical protein GGI21_004004 [Coemansia aciculifera]
MRSVVSRLSFDSAEVKHVLLCSFPVLYGLGQQSLSHIITYLNDRDCWFLRAAFFDVVFAASAQISSHASREYVVPLINLHDQEVFVVISALRALARLVPQLSPAMLWDRLAEVRLACGRVPALRRAAAELSRSVVDGARLPMAADVAETALAMADERAEEPARAASVSAAAAPISADRAVLLRQIGAPLRTVFLTAARDPWAADEPRGLGLFLRRNAPAPSAPELPPAPARLRGALAATASEHADEVTCLVAARGGVFVSGSADGSVRAFDGAAVRKSATLRAGAAHWLGGRVTGLAFSAALDCVAAAADCGRVHVLRASRASLRVLAETRLAPGEHGVGVCFGFGGAVVVATSRSRVLFLRAGRLEPVGAVQLAPALGRPTAVAAIGGSAGACVVVGTAAGACVAVDARFHVVARVFARDAAPAVTALAAFGDDAVLVASAAGDVGVLSLRSGRRLVCVGARPLPELKAALPSRRLRINGLALVQHGSCALAASNDSVLRLWDFGRLERSYAVTSSAAAPSYASYRLNDTVYFCENPQAAASDPSASSAAPISAVAMLHATTPPMVVCGHPSGVIRLLV